MDNFECKECDKKFHSADALNSHNLAKHPKVNTPKFSIKKKHIYFVIFICVAFAITFWIYHSATSPGKYDVFAECLTAEGFIMAGTDRCSNCQKQKNLFGKSFKLIDYKNCDVDKEWCSANGISRYPTWKLPDGNKRQGTQELYSLQQASSNCSL